jgi:hypothetical protein
MCGAAPKRGSTIAIVSGGRSHWFAKRVDRQAEELGPATDKPGFHHRKFCRNAVRNWSQLPCIDRARGKGPCVSEGDGR